MNMDSNQREGLIQAAISSHQSEMLIRNGISSEDLWRYHEAPNREECLNMAMELEVLEKEQAKIERYLLDPFGENETMGHSLMDYDPYEDFFRDDYDA